MAKDISLITDPIQPEYYQSEQARIWEKRDKRDHQSTFIPFEPGQCFDNIASSSDLPLLYHLNQDNILIILQV